MRRRPLPRFQKRRLKRRILVLFIPTGRPNSLTAKKRALPFNRLDIPVEPRVTVKNPVPVETRSVSVNENRVTSIPFIRWFRDGNIVPKQTVRRIQRPLQRTPGDAGLSQESRGIPAIAGTAPDAGPKEPGILCLRGILVTIIAGGSVQECFPTTFFHEVPRTRESRLKRIFCIGYAIIAVFLVNAISGDSSGLFLYYPP